MAGENRLGNGEARLCRHCKEPYREIKRLPEAVGLCPTCFEDALNGE